MFITFRLHHAKPRHPIRITGACIIRINMQFDVFFGKLTTGKWAKIGKCSTDTALNDIRDLVDKGVLKKNEEGGRSTNYSLITE